MTKGNEVNINSTAVSLIALDHRTGSHTIPRQANKTAFAGWISTARSK